jgi:hypothetical protein
MTKQLNEIVRESVEQINEKCWGEEQEFGKYCHLEGLGPEPEPIIKFFLNSQISLLEAELLRKKGMMVDKKSKETTQLHRDYYEGYDNSCQEDITYLTEQIEEINKYFIH